MAAQDPTRQISKAGMPTILPAAPGMREELGKWTNGNYQVAEGQVLKAFGWKKPKGVSQATQGHIYLQARENAALRRIMFNTMAWNRGQFSTVFVEGRFDILTTDQLRALAVNFMANATHLIEDPSHLRVFRIHEVSPEIVPVVEVVTHNVVNSAGEQVAVAAPRRRRGMQL